MAIFIRLTPLRESRLFANLWFSNAFVNISAQMVQMAIAWTIYRETGSSLAVGGLGLAIGIPTVVFGLLGGALTDTRRPRTVGLLGVGGQFIASLSLIAATLLTDFSLLAIYVLVGFQAACGAITAPTRRPYIRHLLQAASIPAAMSLYMLSMNMGQIVGPLFGGLLLDRNPIAVVISVHAIMLVPYFISMLRLPDIQPATQERLTASTVVSGIKTAWNTRSIKAVLLADVLATFFALPMALLPALNDVVLDGNSVTYGWLLSALSLGGLLGTIFSGWLGSVRKPVRMVVCLAVFWCVVVAALGLSTLLLLSIVALLAMGILDTWSVILQQTVVQAEAPESALGRVGSIQNIIGMAGPQLGNFRAGLVGSVIGPQAAITVSAILAMFLIAGSYITQKPDEPKSATPAP